MKRTVEIGPGISDHLNPADMEFSARSVMLPGLFATHKVANNRRRQTLVSDEAVLDSMAEIDETFGAHCQLHPSLIGERLSPMWELSGSRRLKFVISETGRALPRKGMTR